MVGVIVALLLLIVGALVSLVASLMPDLPDPGNLLDDATSPWATIVDSMAGASYWLPFGLVVTVLAVLAVVLLAAGVIRLVRIVASFVTGGGGSAA